MNDIPMLRIVRGSSAGGSGRPKGIQQRHQKQKSSPSFFLSSSSSSSSSLILVFFVVIVTVILPNIFWMKHYFEVSRRSEHNIEDHPVFHHCIERQERNTLLWICDSSSINGNGTSNMTSNDGNINYGNDNDSGVSFKDLAQRPPALPPSKAQSDPQQLLQLAQFLVQQQHEQSQHDTGKKNDTLASPSMTSTNTEIAMNNHALMASCHRYNGILLVTHILPKAGAGTVFFQSILSSLLYAEHYHLRPWIHINSDKNKVVYDSKVHGIDSRSNHTATTTTMTNTTIAHSMGGISNIKGTGNMTCGSMINQRPGSPNFQARAKRQQYTFMGNGLWSSYFEPIIVPELLSDKLQTFHKKSFSRTKQRTNQHDDDDATHDCWSSIPIFQLSFRQATAAMSMCSEHAVRAWPYPGIPKALQPAKHQTIYDWLGNHRQRAAAMIEKYYQPQPWLLKRVNAANPISNNDRKCLSMHVRLTDKANGRDKKDVGVYLQYAFMFVNATNAQYPIYLATDDESVVSTVQQALHPATVLTQPNVIRNTNHSSTTPTFELLQNDTHRSNTEALVDIYAMSKCMYFIHGFSGMSEAVVYISIATATQQQQQQQQSQSRLQSRSQPHSLNTMTSTTGTATTFTKSSWTTTSHKIAAARKYVQDRTINIDNPNRKSRKQARRLFQHMLIHDSQVWRYMLV